MTFVWTGMLLFVCNYSRDAACSRYLVFLLLFAAKSLEYVWCLITVDHNTVTDVFHLFDLSFLSGYKLESNPVLSFSVWWKGLLLNISFAPALAADTSLFILQSGLLYLFGTSVVEFSLAGVNGSLGYIRSRSGLRAERGPCGTGREAGCCTVLCPETVVILFFDLSQ